MIANRVGEKDVLTLNSTCRALRTFVKPVMASIFGFIRTCNLSEQGMAALLTLSRDTACAPYLRTLILLHGGTATPLSLLKTLAEVLKNFSMVSKNHSNLSIRCSTRQHNSGANEIQADFHIRTFARQFLATAKRAELLVSNLVLE